MPKREKPPHIEVVSTLRGLCPHLSDDAEKLVSVPLGHVFELVPVTKRSNRQLRTYWKALGIVVKATGKWPSPEHLHDEIKFTLGYRKLVADLKTGEIAEMVDSIALDKMDHETFCAFMDQAMGLLAEHVGFDPLAFLSEAA
jgi:hypothetical protein